MKVSICREYRKKFGWEMPTLKLARIVYSDNKLLFKDIEDARYWLRYLEGKVAKKDKYLKTVINIENRTRNPYELPKSEETPYEPFIIKGHDFLGILSDIHLPYHDLDALSEAITQLKMVKDRAKNFALLLNGDTLDCHTLSRDRKSTRLNSSHVSESRMPSSA